MRSRILAGIAAGALCVGVLAPATAADAAPKKFSSCAAVHAVYSGGIAKPGVTKNRLTDGTKVPLGGTVKHSRTLYEANYRRLDRDRDGIACEIPALSSRTA